MLYVACLEEVIDIFILFLLSKAVVKFDDMLVLQISINYSLLFFGLSVCLFVFPSVRSFVHTQLVFLVLKHLTHVFWIFIPAICICKNIFHLTA